MYVLVNVQRAPSARLSPVPTPLSVTSPPPYASPMYNVNKIFNNSKAANRKVDVNTGEDLYSQLMKTGKAEMKTRHGTSIVYNKGAPDKEVLLSLSL